VTRFSKIRNSSEFQMFKKRTEVKSTYTERVGRRTRIEMNRSKKTPRGVIRLLALLTESM